MRATTLRIAALMVLLGATPCAWTQTPIVFSQRLDATADDLAPQPQAGPSFGAAVAISGRTALVGMPTHDDAVGRVGVYTRGPEAWLRTTTISNPEAGQREFGRALDFDSGSAVVDAHSAAYLYRKHGGRWLLIAALARSDPIETIGSNVAVSDGFVARSVQTFQFGSGDVPGMDRPGVVHVYQQHPHGLRRVATLRASDADPEDRFGVSLAMERGVLVVGAPGRGAAYVFARDREQWVQRQKLVSSDGGIGGFGTSVAIRGGIILVGAPGVDLPGEDNTTVAEGNAYVFLPHRGTWFESQRLNDQGQFFAQFGTNAALSRDLGAVVAPIDEAFSSFRSTVVAFDRVGVELTSGRGALSTGSSGDRVVAIDVSKRRLIAGVRESEVHGAGPLFGWVRIVEFGEGTAGND